MSDSDDALRGALRDLIPDYAGPVDPLPRVVASVRRRRVRQRTLLALTSAGAAATVAFGVPVLVAAGPGAGQAASPGVATGPVPSASGAAAPPRPEAPVHVVARGSIGSTPWSVGSVALEAGSPRCLTSDGGLFRRDTVCFPAWKAGGPVTWVDQRFPGPVTRVVGVAPGGATEVRIRLTDGTTTSAAAVRTPTDPAGRFFGLVLPGTRTVRDVTALSPTGASLGPPVTAPGTPPCVPGPAVACTAK